MKLTVKELVEIRSIAVNDGKRNRESEINDLALEISKLKNEKIQLEEHLKLEKAEKEELLREKEIEKLAKVKGITFYEASVLKKLMDEGKV